MATIKIRSAMIAPNPPRGFFLKNSRIWLERLRLARTPEIICSRWPSPLDSRCRLIIHNCMPV